MITSYMDAPLISPMVANPTEYDNNRTSDSKITERYSLIELKCISIYRPDIIAGTTHFAAVAAIALRNITIQSYMHRIY